MDPKTAILLIVGALATDTAVECKDGACVNQQAPAELEITGSALVFREETVGAELQVRHVGKWKYGPLRSVVGGSVSSKGDLWVGAGLKWQTSLNASDTLYAEFSTMPGVYMPGGGPDLGHTIEFRTAATLGMRLDNGANIAISLDHRSNADIADYNPGLETLGLRYTIPLN